MNFAEKARKVFKEEKVMNIQQLKTAFGKSIPCVRNYLKKWNVITSYNKNGGYYVLPENVRFDTSGFWGCRGVLFSKFGNLRKTLPLVIENSEFGLTAREIGKIIHLDPRSFLSHFRDIPELRREKISGKYIYFSGREDIFVRQYRHRSEKIEAYRPLFGETGILILAERINHPDGRIDLLLKHLKNRGVSIKKNDLCDFLENYDLKKSPGFNAVTTLSCLLAETAEAVSPKNLFGKLPPVTFAPEEKCDCAVLYNTRNKTVYTMHIGGFIAREKVYECKNPSCVHCGEKFYSDELRKLVPPLCNFGYDVTVFVGEAVFSHHRKAEEVVTELADRNISMSVSEVYYQTEKFIMLLAALHSSRKKNICELFHENGGYILHIDTTGDKGSMRLLTGIDSISGTVLDSVKVSSEKSSKMEPFLKKIDDDFGPPLVVVQDMSKAIMNAVGEAFPDVSILICHFHFLRDIGKDLLGKEYDTVRKRLQHHGILTVMRDLAKPLKELVDENAGEAADICELMEEENISSEFSSFSSAMNFYLLVLWMQEGRKLGNGYGFPFDRMHFDFVLRLNRGHQIISECEKILSGEADMGKKVFKMLLKLGNKLKEIVGDKEIQSAVAAIITKVPVFEKLRDAMRIAPKNGNEGLKDGGGNENMKNIEKKVEALRLKLIYSDLYKENNEVRGFVAQIDKYWKKLFADPIEVETPNGKKTIQPQRTNNISEQFYRDIQHDAMRRTGSRISGKSFNAMVAEMPLVKNLQNKSYMNVILKKNETLVEAFANLDQEKIRQKMDETKFYSAKFKEKLKKIAASQKLPDMILDFLKKKKEKSLK